MALHKNKYAFTLPDDGFLTRCLSVQTDRMFDIANVPLAQVTDEEKIKFDGKMQQTGSYQGYKPRQYWVMSILTLPLRRPHYLSRAANRQRSP